MFVLLVLDLLAFALFMLSSPMFALLLLNFIACLLFPLDLLIIELCRLFLIMGSAEGCRKTLKEWLW